MGSLEKHRRPHSSERTRKQKLVYRDVRPSPYEQFFPTKAVVTPTRSFIPPNFFFPQASMKKEPEYSVIFNVAGTKYRIVKEVGGDILDWVLTTNPEDEWDVAWIDCYQDFTDFTKLKSYQRVNFFPGIGCLARKDNLSRNLIRLKKMFPDEYDFFPETFVMPMDYEAFKAQFPKTGKQPTFIVKPQASSQGRGIFLTQTWKNVPNSHRYVVQRYITNPYLLDELKFDLRIYVLVTSVEPLKIFLFKDGLARFATEKYKDAGADNITNMFMHLTNYAINKNSTNFVFNVDERDDSTGHKRSIKALFKTLQERGRDTKKLWIDIKKIVIKTFCSVQTTLAQKYKATFSKKHGNKAAFQVFGFDVMIDEHFKPWLLEVNSSPSLSSDTPLDRNIKEKVIGDALKITGISSHERINVRMKQQARELQNRIERLYKIPKQDQEMSYEHIEHEFDEARVVKESGYEMIYPPKENAKHKEDYNVYMKEIKMFRSHSIEMSQKKKNENKKELERPRSSSNSNSFLANSKVRKSSSRQDLAESKTTTATKERPKSSMSHYNSNLSYKKVQNSSPQKKAEEQPQQTPEPEEKPKIILTRYELPQKVMLSSSPKEFKTKTVSLEKSFDDSGKKVQRYAVKTKTPGISVATEKIVKSFNKVAAQKVYKDSKEATTEASSNDSYIEKKKVVNKSLIDFKSHHQTPEKKRSVSKKLFAKKNNSQHKSSSDLLEKSADSETNAVNVTNGLVEKFKKFSNVSMKRLEEGAISHACSGSKSSPRGVQRGNSMSMKNPPTDSSFYRVNTDSSANRRDADEDIKSSLPKRFAQFLSKIDSEDRRINAQTFHVAHQGIFAAKNSVNAIEYDRTTPVKSPSNQKSVMKTKAAYYEKIPTELTPTRNSNYQKAQPKLTNFIMPGLFDGAKVDRAGNFPTGLSMSQNSTNGYGIKVITKGKSLLLNVQNA